MLQTNIIYCGDNIKKLKEIPDESIDFIYIDPPFNSNRNYEIFWGDTKEKRAFEDRFGDAIHYINWMRPRVMELYRVLKKSGSFYYHCDWHASHYVKILLDEIFGYNNFQNEIIWCYKTGGATKRRFGRKHDTIFFYTETSGYIFNPQKEKSYMMHEYGFKKSDFQKDEHGQYSWVIAKDWWEIPAIGSATKERLGYPTQKPEKLLTKIIKASSNEGDVVLDAFCGCGTTIAVAHRLKRRWIGIDISPTACRVIAKRLRDSLGLKEGEAFWIRDLPKTEEELRKYPPFEFQNWAVNALGGIPSRRRVGDMGIDGRIYPVEDVQREKREERDLFGEIDRYFPVQVKQQDKVGRPAIDSFETAMRRDKRNKGFFVVFSFTKGALREIKRVMRKEGLEIIPITVREILDEELNNKI